MSFHIFFGIKGIFLLMFSFIYQQIYVVTKWPYKIYKKLPVKKMYLFAEFTLVNPASVCYRHSWPAGSAVVMWPHIPVHEYWVIGRVQPGDSQASACL